VHLSWKLRDCVFGWPIVEDALISSLDKPASGIALSIHLDGRADTVVGELGYTEAALAL